MKKKLKKIKSVKKHVFFSHEKKTVRKKNVFFSNTKLEEVKSLHIRGVTFDSKLTFETHLREVALKTALSLGVVSQAGKLFDFSCVLKNCFNTYVLPNLDYCARMWMASAESHLSLLIVLFVVRKCCVRENFVFWGTEGKSVPCVCSITFITKLTILCISMQDINSLKLVKNFTEHSTASFIATA